MKLLWYILFGPVGIVCVEEEGKLSRSKALKRLLSGGVRNGVPSTQEIDSWFRLKKPLMRLRCKVCGVYFWSWRKRTVCHKWECYKCT